MHRHTSPKRLRTHQTSFSSSVTHALTHHPPLVVVRPSVRPSTPRDSADEESPIVTRPASSSSSSSRTHRRDGFRVLRRFRRPAPARARSFPDRDLLPILVVPRHVRFDDSMDASACAPDSTRLDSTRLDSTRSRTHIAILPTCVLIIKQYKTHRETDYDTEPPVPFACRISRTTNHESRIAKKAPYPTHRGRARSRTR